MQLVRLLIIFTLLITKVRINTNIKNSSCNVCFNWKENAQKYADFVKIYAALTIWINQKITKQNAKTI